MKIHLEVDLSPEELRRFVGLPDVQPFWDAVYRRISESDTETLQQFAKTAFTESYKTLDLTARILKTLGTYATQRGGDDDKKTSPTKSTHTTNRGDGQSRTSTAARKSTTRK